MSEKTISKLTKLTESDPNRSIIETEQGGCWLLAVIGYSSLSTVNVSAAANQCPTIIRAPYQSGMIFGVVAAFLTRPLQIVVPPPPIGDFFHQHTAAIKLKFMEALVELAVAIYESMSSYRKERVTKVWGEDLGETIIIHQKFTKQQETKMK